MDTKIKFVFRRGRARDNIIQYHTHDRYELVYYEKGCGISRIGDTDYKYHEGQFCIIPPGVVHMETAHDETIVICISYSCNDSLYAFEAILADDTRDREIYQIVCDLMSEMQSRRTMSMEVSEGYLAVLLMKLRRCICTGDAERRPDSSMLSSVYSYICEYYNTDIRLRELASSVGYSYDRFRHIFAQRFGISPKQLILKRRIEAAKQMLLLGNDKIECIARQCGFNSTSQFTVIFKQSQGIPPTEYRKGGILH